MDTGGLGKRRPLDSGRALRYSRRGAQLYLYAGLGVNGSELDAPLTEMLLMKMLVAGVAAASTTTAASATLAVIIAPASCSRGARVQTSTV